MTALTKPKIKLRTTCVRYLIEKYAKQSLDSRLYVSGWHLSYVYRSILEGRDSCGVFSIAHDGKRAVGVCLIDGGSIMVFVKVSYRKMGIGTKLVKKTMSRYKSKFGGPITAQIGLRWTEKFWHDTCVKVNR